MDWNLKEKSRKKFVPARKKTGSVMWAFLEFKMGPVA